MGNKTTLAVLLGADRGKLKLVPTKQMEITRLSGAVGEPVIFTIRALTGEEFQEAQEAAMNITKRGEVEDVDGRMLQVMCVLNGTQDPNLKDKQLLELYEAVTPEDLLNGTFLLPGEVSQLFNAIQELSGFGAAAVAEVKN
jgi:hypothetical protein